MNDFPSYPARPTNGGALESALPKVGLWAWQPKVADWRGLVHANTGWIWNRHGGRLSIADKIQPALAQLQERIGGWLDVGVMERQPLMRGCIIIFDFIPDGVDADEMRIWTYDQRRESLEKHCGFEVMPLDQFPQSNRVFLIPHFIGRPDGTCCGAGPLMLYKKLDELNRQFGAVGTPGHPLLYEGLVAKRRDKPYPIQLRSPNVKTPWWIKHRFDQ
jgi:hypothetical protein